MNQPLGTAIGNALDVAEAVAILRGERGGRLLDLVIELAAAAQVALGGAEEGEARRHARDAIASGRAAETFRAMVAAQGGDPRVIDDPAAVLPSAPVVRPILLERSGVLGGVDAEGLGRAAAALGAGRRRKGDPVDPAVGIVFAPKIGDEIHAGGTAGEIHARSEDAADEAHRRVVSALEVVDGPVDPPPLVYGWRSEGSDPSRTS